MPIADIIGALIYCGYSSETVVTFLMSAANEEKNMVITVNNSLHYKGRIQLQAFSRLKTMYIIQGPANSKGTFNLPVYQTRQCLSHNPEISG